LNNSTPASVTQEDVGEICKVAPSDVKNVRANAASWAYSVIPTVTERAVDRLT